MSESLLCLYLGPPGETSRRVLEILQLVTYHSVGVKLARLDTSSPYGELVSSVSESIYRTLERADLIIADITDGHPNVMYELGFVHALKKPVLPLVQRGAGQVPSDLSGYLYFTYDTDDPDNLIRVVTEWIERNRKSRREA